MLFNLAKECNIKVATYVSIFEKVIFQLSKTGLYITGLGGSIATAITINSCYASNQAEYGYYMRNVVYSTMNSCACDEAREVGYRLTNVRAFTLNGCGAENSKKLIWAESFFALSIHSFYSLRCGSEESGNPTEYLIEFGNGRDAVVNGVWVQAANHYTYKLGLTSNSWGAENITVLDHSITREETYFISNWSFHRPIKFLRDDETTKDETITIDASELPEQLRRFEFKEINHNIVIQLNNGVQPDLTRSQNILNVKGNGQLIIRGNASDRGLVRLHGAYDRFLVKDCSVKIVFQNLTLENRTDSGYSRILRIDNCRNVILDNTEFRNNLPRCGAAIELDN